MFLKTATFCLFFSQHISAILAQCWIRHNNNNHFLPSRLNDPKRIFCKVGLEVCCPDGCCNSSSLYTIYPYIWEIVVTAMLIFMSLLVCVFGFYYCKYSFRKTAFVTAVDTRMVDRRDVQNQPISGRAPPPAYDVAILLPRCSPSERIPTYEEAVSKERF